MIVNDSAMGPPMTPRQFKASITALGLSQGRTARLCGYYPGTAKKWASGGRKVPETVAIILRLMQAGVLTVAHLESAAKPTRSKRK
jgi:DNA-binding transcriptional regulator YiaG